MTSSVRTTPILHLPHHPRSTADPSVTGSCAQQPGVGTCWEPVRDTLCRQTACPSRWACTCASATHHCAVGRQSAYVPLGGTGDVRACAQTQSVGALQPTLRLGSLSVAVSRRGLAADACAELTVYHNGRMVASHQCRGAAAADDAALDAALRTRAETNGLALQAGDAVAFRFSNASYHCFGNLVRAKVGDRMRTSAPGGGLVVRFARARVEGWAARKFDVGAHAAKDERVARRGEFLPMRVRTLERGAPIEPGADLWRPADQSSKDHRLGNWYWRVDVPK